MINLYTNAWLGLPILKLINDIYQLATAPAATNILLVILPVGLFLAAALFTFIYYYSYRQIKCTDSLTEEETNKLIKFSGYKYDEDQDIFYNHDNAWQEDFGYCELYDNALAPLGMIIDCEPIYFEHDSKRWLVEFWKGQYGMTTGCEVGIYSTDTEDIHIPGVFTGPFFRCATGIESVQIGYTLNKNNTPLFVRSDRNWWVTGFRLGEFSYPSELVLDISISMENADMRNSFLLALEKVGYFSSHIVVNNDIIQITFAKPMTIQPKSRTADIERAVQWKNERLCQMYKDITKEYDNTPNKLAALKVQSPQLYTKVLSFGKPQGIYDYYKALNV